MKPPHPPTAGTSGAIIFIMTVLWMALTVFLLLR